MREELSHFRWRRRCGRWCWAYWRALNNVDQWESFNNCANQWEKSFLISGDGGGAEDDAEHIREYGGGVGEVPGSLREGGLLQLHVQLCPPLLACPASKQLINNHVILKEFLLKFAFLYLSSTFKAHSLFLSGKSKSLQCSVCGHKLLFHLPVIFDDFR